MLEVKFWGDKSDEKRKENRFPLKTVVKVTSDRKKNLEMWTSNISKKGIALHALKWWMCRDCTCSLECNNEFGSTSCIYSGIEKEIRSGSVFSMNISFFPKKLYLTVEGKIAWIKKQDDRYIIGIEFNKPVGDSFSIDKRTKIDQRLWVRRRAARRNAERRAIDMPVKIDDRRTRERRKENRRKIERRAKERRKDK